MGHATKTSAPEVRRWLGSLLVAWTFVTGLAVTFASAYWFRTGDINVLLAWVGAPFLIGCALFLFLGLMALATRTKVHEAIEPDGVRARKQKEGWFGK